MTTINRYLPVGSRIAVRNQKGEISWYTTKEEVPVPSGDLLVAECPMRTGVAVNTFDYKGCGLFFLIEQVRTKFTKDQLESAKKLELYRLEYDVPTFRPEGVEFQHPSTYLHTVAARSTLSCWVIPKNAINSVMTRLNQLTDVGSTWNVEKIDSSEIENTLNRIITAVQKEVNQLVRSTTDAQERAATQLEATPDEDDPNKALKRYTARANQTLKKNRKILGELEQVCRTFGISGASDWAKAKGAIKVTENLIQTRARLFTEAVHTARTDGSRTGQAMAAAVEQGQVDPAILADYLEDEGHQEQADTLRTAFNESDTFSLAD